MLTQSLVKLSNMLTKKRLKTNQENNIALALDTTQYHVLIPQHINKDSPQLFDPIRIQTDISPNTLTAQDAGIFSQKEPKLSWNCVLFTKHSDNPLRLLGEAISYELMSKQSSELLPNKPYIALRIGLHDFMLNFNPFRTLEWFNDAFIKLFDYPGYILTQCGISLSTALFNLLSIHSIVFIPFLPFKKIL